MSVAEAVILEKNEKIIDSWEGSRAIFKEINKSDKETKFKAKEWKKGYLVLTSRRLLFIDEEPVIGQSASVSLKKLAETFCDKTTHRNKVPHKRENICF